MTRVYAFLLLLYPRAYRRVFGEEMLRVFNEVCAGRRTAGSAAYALTALRELGGLICSAAAMRAGLADWKSPLLATLGCLLGVMAPAGLFLQMSEFGHLRFARSAPASQLHLDLVVIAALCVAMIAACAIAFVVNLRIIAQRAGSMGEPRAKRNRIAARG